MPHTLQDILSRDDVKQLILETPVGVLSTSEGNIVASSAMFYAVDKECNIYLHTKINSQKYRNITHNKNVAFVIYSENPVRTLQLQGEATKVLYTDKEEVFQDLIKRTTARGVNPPLMKLASGEVALIKITPRWVRFGDFSYDTDEEIAVELRTSL